MGNSIIWLHSLLHRSLDAIDVAADQHQPGEAPFYLMSTMEITDQSWIQSCSNTLGSRAFAEWRLIFI